MMMQAMCLTMSLVHGQRTSEPVSYAWSTHVPPSQRPDADVMRSCLRRCGATVEVCSLDAATGPTVVPVLAAMGSRVPSGVGGRGFTTWARVWVRLPLCVCVCSCLNTYTCWCTH